MTEDVTVALCSNNTLVMMLVRSLQCASDEHTYTKYRTNQLPVAL